ncbi:MAG TPA: alpha/beta fold hydrolase, partial [Candidatus Binataceae bacterium]|nr:alpha/beta fold hydrolase [Candidatus Binataceae bacterium]
MAETFVLVHGAWHGSFCWAAVANELGKHGDHCHAVDLPGNNANPMDRARVTLQTYIDSVVKFIEARDLHNVVLAGHSMAGLVMPGVVAKIPERLKRVVFVTAIVAEDGKAGLDAGNPTAAARIQMANSRYDKSLSIEAMAENFRTFFMQDAKKEMQDWVLATLCPQPIQPMLDPVDMKSFHATGVPQSYLVCENDLAPDGHPLWHPTYSGRLKNPSIRNIKSGHEVM